MPKKRGGRIATQKPARFVSASQTLLDFPPPPRLARLDVACARTAVSCVCLRFRDLLELEKNLNMAIKLG